MIEPTKINSVFDVILWLEEAISVTPYGKVGIEVVMQDGKPQRVIPKWEPNIRLSQGFSSGKVDNKT